MKWLAAFFALCQCAFLAAPAAAAEAGGARVVSSESWVEEWDPREGRWVRISEITRTGPDMPAAAIDMPSVTTTYLNDRVVDQTRSAARYAAPQHRGSAEQAFAQYGPFRVAEPGRAVIVGSTDASSPRDFDAMLRDFPGIRVLEMVEAPGTSNDIANLAVGRRIRAAGIATHVPRGGSVRSGAVELFLAGATRTLEDGAQFAVHSWLDNHGREADDVGAGDAAHRMYVDYYVEMGMSAPAARAFYAMTNSVPHHSALWLGAQEIRGWLPPAGSRAGPAFVIAPEPLAAPARPAPAKVLALAPGPRKPALPPALWLPEPLIAYADLATIAPRFLPDPRLDSSTRIS
ncbi:alpha/beta hydrolase [Erythrobacter sp.]|jgi:hypothetical protein|uniref:alpha/beta hydrolase n=1 Tax=Erythrobacter sp. TaxID=1042 RepID=UPI002EC9F424|nr:alpha/beta hydrolase [Erythrobacter sp.]